MSRIDPTVKKETGYIAGWVLLLSAVMELVFLLTGHMDYTVPLGNLLGGVAAILNFFLMGWTIQRAVGLDEKAAAAKLKLSQLLRMLMLMARAKSQLSSAAELMAQSIEAALARIFAAI